MPSEKQKAKASLKPRYTVVIQWSDEDDCFVVSLPEWGTGAKTHGDTYEEAAKNAREVLKLLMQSATSGAGQLPEPKLFRYPGADVVSLPGRPAGRPRVKQVKQTA
jgi:antitoxin HicB